MTSLHQLNQSIITCNKCSRLRAWSTSRQGENKRYADQSYWGKPVPGFGDVGARILIVGLAPGAHGANRTGRAFTGDFAGDILYEGLYRAGLCNTPTSIHRDDGLQLKDVYITNAVRCAPPKDKPDLQEFSSCAPFLTRELELLENVKVIVPLGHKAFDAIKKSYASSAQLGKFAHGEVVGKVHGNISVLCCYHTSRRNVNGGKMDANKLVVVLETAKELSKS